MKQESAKLIADVAVTLSLGTGVATGAGSSWLSHLNENAPAYGVLLTLFFGLCGVIFYIMSYRKSILADANAEKIQDLQSRLNEFLDNKDGDKGE